MSARVEAASPSTDGAASSVPSARSTSKIATGPVGDAAAQHDPVAVDREAAHLGERDRDLADRSRRRPDPVEPVAAAAPADRDDRAVRREGERASSRRPSPGTRTRRRAAATRLGTVGAEPVDVHPAGRLGGEVEDAVRRPARLRDPVGRAAGDRARGLDRPVRSDVGELQLRPVPRHVRVAPLEPRELGTVGERRGAA